VSQAAR